MCDVEMRVELAHHLRNLAQRHVLAVVFFVILFTVGRAQGETPVQAQSESGISNDQRSVNDLLGAPLINSADSSIATENTKFSQETAYSKQQNKLASQKSIELGASQNTEDAKTVIREVLGLDASAMIKTDFRKASLLQLATHSEQKKAYEEAQKYLSEYLRRYPDDALIPVVLLRQGDLFRKMGAYDLERQKYYDVIKSAPKVKLEGKFDLPYVKRIALIARSQIADSFYEEAGKLPDHRAKEKYVSASEMYSRLLGAEQAEKRVVTIKYIRALYKQGNHDGVVNAGGSYFTQFNDGPAMDEDEVRYLVLDSARQGSGSTHDYLAGYRDWFKSPPRGGSTGDALKWRLKAAGDLAGKLFNDGNYVDSLEFYQALAGLVSGSAVRPDEYLHLMLGIKRVLAMAEPLEAEGAHGSEIFNAIEPMLLKVKSRARSSAVNLKSIDSVSSDSGKGKINPGVDWSNLKPMLVKTHDDLKVECQNAYTAVIPILYRIALCSENIPGQSALDVYEKIRVGVVDIEAAPGVALPNAIFASQETKFHIISNQTEGKDPQGVLVCAWHGIPSPGMELINEDTGDSIKIIDFVGLAKLGDGTSLHEKSLPLKLISDMAAWRINTLKWEERFKKQVAEIAN